jgi:AcrR family transcriptional regulator
MRQRKKTRPYDASGRQQRAVENQERALVVARRLFAERGYAETTMEEIAAEAGMAAPTLYAAFGSKRGVLARLLDRLVSGEPDGRSVLQTSGARQVFAETDPRRALRAFAQHMNGIQERVSPIHEVMKSAARSEPTVAELYERSQATRAANLTALAARVAEVGPLREGLTVDDAGRTIWVLASSEVRQMLLTHAGWTPEHYAEWLGETLCAALLGAPGKRHKIP